MDPAKTTARPCQPPRFRLRPTSIHCDHAMPKTQADLFAFLDSVDLKSVHQAIGAASRVSFGKPEALMELLGVAPGSVTAFGAINDTGLRVRIVLDAPLLDHGLVNAHPLTNEATTSIAPAGLVRFIEATGHEPVILKVSM